MKIVSNKTGRRLIKLEEQKLKNEFQIGKKLKTMNIKYKTLTSHWSINC